MEAAAKSVEALSENLLPEKPHQLSFSPDWRYRPPPDDDETTSRGARRRFEEWHNTRLQYLTFLSGDRGTLLTRSYYDMREEPLKPVPREVSALSKGASTGEKKKLSLSDYRNKKTGAAASASPPEPAIAKKRESERAAASTASPASASASATAVDGGRTYPDARKSDGPRIREADSSLGAKPKSTRDNIVVDTRLPPKPPSLPPRPPSPLTKRRIPDADDDSRPQKRSRPDERRLTNDRSPLNRDDPQRRKDRYQSSSRDRDTSTSRDDRGYPPPSIPNGKSILKGAANSGRNTPSAGRSRGDSMNGVRPSALGNNNARQTPTRPETSNKTSVPPLLSPLHLGFNDREKRSRADDDDLSPKKERRKRDDGEDAMASSRQRKPEPISTSVPKKPKPPIVIPPLLSPTLPPAIEAELRRRKKGSSDSSDERPRETNRDGRDTLGTKRRPEATVEEEEEEPKPANRLGHRRRLMLSLSVPKRLRASFARIIGQSTSRKKEAQSQYERENDRDDRADSDDVEQRQPAPARKRPIGGAEGPLDAVATKRPRSSEVSTKLGTPSTPSKKTTAMSRVSSTNSVAQTPMEPVNATPSAAASASADRRPNGSDVPVKGDKPEAKAMREKEERLKAVGKKLKHEADLIMKRHRGDSSASMKGRPGESKVKLGYVLSLESIISFIMGFHAQNLHRGMYNKIGDPTGWASMFPLMEFLQNEMRRADVSNYQPLYAMLLLLHAVSLDEMIKCYVHFDNPSSHLSIDTLTKQERKKYRMWPQIHEANGAVASSRMRVDVQPWSTLDDITDASLKVLRLWCAEEKIDWNQEQTLRDSWPVRPSHTRR